MALQLLFRTPETKIKTRSNLPQSVMRWDSSNNPNVDCLHPTTKNHVPTFDFVSKTNIIQQESKSKLQGNWENNFKVTYPSWESKGTPLMVNKSLMRPWGSTLRFRSGPYTCDWCDSFPVTASANRFCPWRHWRQRTRPSFRHLPWRCIMWPTHGKAHLLKWNNSSAWVAWVNSCHNIWIFFTLRPHFNSEVFIPCTNKNIV